MDAQFVGLDQRRPRAAEGVQYRLPGPEILAQEDFHQLGNEFAQVRVQPVHVLGAFWFLEVAFVPV